MIGPAAAKHKPCVICQKRTSANCNIEGISPVCFKCAFEELRTRATVDQFHKEEEQRDEGI